MLYDPEYAILSNDEIRDETEQMEKMRHGREKTILIIEDDADISRLLYTALSKAGYDAVQAYSGTEGRMLLGMKEKVFALILLESDAARNVRGRTAFGYPLRE